MNRIRIDDRLEAASGACIPIGDRGFTLGDALFETMRVSGGRVFRLAPHLARLHDAAARIGLPVPRDLATAVTGTVAANGIVEGAVRLTLTRGDAPPGLRPPAEPAPRLVVAAYEYRPPAREAEAGVRAILASGRVNELGAAAGLKHAGYMEAILAQREADAHGVEEAILLDTRGRLAEAAAANLFLVSNGALVTPGLACGVLPGITRAAVLELAPRLGVAAEEAALGPERLFAADEAFLTSSLRGVIPLVEVDGRPVGSGRPGSLTRRLQTAYRELVVHETAPEGAAHPPA